MAIRIIFPKNGDTVSLQTEAQRAFLKSEETRAATDGALHAKVREHTDWLTDETRPAPVSVRFRDSDGKGHYLLLLSERADMKGAHVTFTQTHTAHIYNLKADTLYYLCVQKDGMRSATVAFRTANDLPRTIFAEGVPNLRDIGGYAVKGGKIRQGLLFRGSELEIHTHVSEKGASALRSLGIRTDLDLRGEAKTNILFPTSRTIGLRYTLIPSPAYDDMFAEEHKKNVKRWFTFISQKRHYPIYFHCWGGADRTGTYAFLLGAFLGRDKKSLIDEYEFTSLSVWGIRTRNHPPFERFLSIFESFLGESYQDKATYFLKEHLGLSDEVLKRLEDILIEREQA